jgi:dihydrofolate reductase
MGKIVVTEFSSLDGVMQAPGGEEFKYPGWSFEFDRGEDGDKFKLDETMGSDAVLLGRRTYESFAGAWPDRDGPFAEKLNEMPKFLVSSTITEPEWKNTTRLEGDVVEAVRKLRDEFDGVIQVPGSHQLVQTLVENDLVDQVNLMIFPVVLGTGKRVFGDYSDKKTMRLVESKTVGEGIVVLVYERA